MLEHAIRDDLNTNAARLWRYLHRKLVFKKRPENQVEDLTAAAHPNRPEMGSRTLPFTRKSILIAKTLPKIPRCLVKFKRLVSGEYVRLRSVCDRGSVVKDDNGEIVGMLLMSGTVGMDPPADIRPRGVIIGYQQVC